MTAPKTSSAEMRQLSAPTVGVIYNPRSHRNRGQDLDANPAPQVYVAQPGERHQLPAALQRFKDRQIDLLVINGGDGTVRDVLTSGLGVFGDEWPAVAVLPKGKTNALTVDLDAPKEWSLQGAIDAFIKGRRIKRRPLKIARADGGGDAMLGFILGAGAFAVGIDKGQDAHRFGAFNSLAVGVTAAWGIGTAIFGSRQSEWRRGAKMDLLLGPDRAPLDRSEGGDPEFRQLLLASTLERFPMGIKPFGPHREGLKLAVLDQPTRRTILRLPWILAGNQLKDMGQRGFHQLQTPSFEVDLGEKFILDGEAYPAGRYLVEGGPEITFVAP